MDKKIKAILFDLDDTLHDSTGQVDTARKAAATAIYNEGILPATSPEEVYKKYLEIVKKYGTNYEGHLSILCKKYGIKPDPRLVAAGRVAYHNTKFALLTLLPRTQETLLWLIKNNFKLGIVTNGIEEKQWEKIIRLKIRPFFDDIQISESIGGHDQKKRLILTCLRNLKIKPEEAMLVGDKIKTDIVSANKLGLTTVRIIHGRYKDEKSRSELEKPTYTIKEISELIKILKKYNI